MTNFDAEVEIYMYGVIKEQCNGLQRCRDCIFHNKRIPHCKVDHDSTAVLYEVWKSNRFQIRRGEK